MRPFGEFDKDLIRARDGSGITRRGRRVYSEQPGLRLADLARESRIAEGSGMKIGKHRRRAQKIKSDPSLEKR